MVDSWSIDSQNLTSSALALLSDKLVESISQTNTVRVRARKGQAQTDGYICCWFCCLIQGKWLMTEAHLSHVVFFSEKAAIPPLVKSLSLFFEGQIMLGVSLGKNKEVGTF